MNIDAPRYTLAREIAAKAEAVINQRPCWKAKNLVFKLRLERTKRNLSAAGVALKILGFERAITKAPGRHGYAPLWVKKEAEEA